MKEAQFNIICDESCLNHRYMILGAMVLSESWHQVLQKELLNWKRNNGFNPESEFKWTKVSKRYLFYYKELIDWIFEHNHEFHFFFRVHVIDTFIPAYLDMSKGDAELSFFSVYYDLLYQSLRMLSKKAGHHYSIILDNKSPYASFSLKKFEHTLNETLKHDFSSNIIKTNIDFQNSSGTQTESLIQIVDILIGAIGFVRNGFIDKRMCSPSKKHLCDYIESRCNCELAFDTPPSPPFSIWTFDSRAAHQFQTPRLFP